MVTFKKHKTKNQISSTAFILKNVGRNQQNNLNLNTFHTFFCEQVVEYKTKTDLVSI